MTVTTPDTQLSFRRPSGSRTIKNTLAKIYVYLATLLAIIPLVWVLYTVISKGARLVFTSTWWLQSQRGITPRREGGGAYHAIIGTVEIASVEDLGGGWWHVVSRFDLRVEGAEKPSCVAESVTRLLADE